MRFVATVLLGLLLVLAGCGEDQFTREKREWLEWCDKQPAPALKLTIDPIDLDTARVKTTVPEGLIGTVEYRLVSNAIQHTGSFTVTGMYSQVRDLSGLPEGMYLVSLTAIRQYPAPEGKWMFMTMPCERQGLASADLIVDRSAPSIQLSTTPLDETTVVITLGATDLSGISQVRVKGVNLQVDPSQLNLLGASSFPISYTEIRSDVIEVEVEDNRGHTHSAAVSIQLWPNRWELRTVNPLSQVLGEHDRGRLIGVAPDSIEAPDAPLWGYGLGREWRRVSEGQETGQTAYTSPIIYAFIALTGAWVLFFLYLRRRQIRRRIARLQTELEYQTWLRNRDRLRELLAGYRWEEARLIWQALIEQRERFDESDLLDEASQRLAAGRENDEQIGESAWAAIDRCDWERAEGHIRRMPEDWRGRHSRDGLWSEMVEKALEGALYDRALRAARQISEPTRAHPTFQVVAIRSMEEGEWPTAYLAVSLLPEDWSHNGLTQPELLDHLEEKWAADLIERWLEQTYDFTVLANDESPSGATTLMRTLREKPSYYHILGFSAAEEEEPSLITYAEVQRRGSELLERFDPARGITEDRLAFARTYLVLDSAVPDRVLRTLLTLKRGGEAPEPYNTIGAAYQSLVSPRFRADYDELLKAARSRNLRAISGQG